MSTAPSAKKKAAKKQAKTVNQAIPQRTFQLLRTEDNHLLGEVTGYYVDLVKGLEDGTCLKLISLSEMNERGLESSAAAEI